MAIRKDVKDLLWRLVEPSLVEVFEAGRRRGREEAAKPPKPEQEVKPALVIHTENVMEAIKTEREACAEELEALLPHLYSFGNPRAIVREAQRLIRDRAVREYEQ